MESTTESPRNHKGKPCWSTLLGTTIAPRKMQLLGSFCSKKRPNSDIKVLERFTSTMGHPNFWATSAMRNYGYFTFNLNSLKDQSGYESWEGDIGKHSPAIGLLGETRRHSGSFLIKRWYSVLCHFLQGTSHFSVLDIKWVSVTQVPSYLHSFMCPGEPWSSYSSFVHCSWYQ